MDDGRMPYVVLRGNRVAVMDGTMRHLGLVAGQTISDLLFGEILQCHLAEARRKCDEAAAQAGD
jgi:hypothetical protein